MPAYPPPDLRARWVRDYLLVTFGQVLLALVLLFLILRVAAPFLVSGHTDLGLCLAVVLFGACPLILAQLAWSLLRGWRRLQRRLHPKPSVVQPLSLRSPDP